MNNSDKLPVGTKVVVKVDAWIHTPNGYEGLIIKQQDEDAAFDYRVRLTNGGLSGHELPVYAGEITPIVVATKPVVQFPRQAERDRQWQEILDHEKVDDNSIVHAIVCALEDEDVQKALAKAIKANLNERGISSRRLLMEYRHGDYTPSDVSHKVMDHENWLVWNFFSVCQELALDEEWVEYCKEIGRDVE
jgi:hypothetical protein